MVLVVYDVHQCNYLCMHFTFSAVINIADYAWMLVIYDANQRINAGYRMPPWVSYLYCQVL